MIIAEIGLNHNGDMNIARALVAEAKAAGADIAKFQFFDASKYFPKDFEWMAACMDARLTFEQAKMLKNYCDELNIEFMASAFDRQGLDWCLELGVKRLKLASRCIEQTDLIEDMRATGLELIVSLGMWNNVEFPEIFGNTPVHYLYCISKYPTEFEDLKFDTVDFSRYSGFSDHTIGLDAASVAIARGAKIIEKHFTLSKKMYGPDHSGSMEPHELKILVETFKRYSRVLGHK